MNAAAADGLVHSPAQVFTLNCRLCAGTTTRVFEARGHQVLDCSGCGHRFAGIAADELHVREHYGDDYFSGGGAGYSDYNAEADLLRERGQMYARKIAPYTTTGVMLDVGAAAGHILQGFQDRGWQGTGVEPNASMAAIAEERYGLTKHRGPLETV